MHCRRDREKITTFRHLAVSPHSPHHLTYTFCILLTVPRQQTLIYLISATMLGPITNVTSSDPPGDLLGSVPLTERPTIQERPEETPATNPINKGKEAHPALPAVLKNVSNDQFEDADDADKEREKEEEAEEQVTIEAPQAHVKGEEKQEAADSEVSKNEKSNSNPLDFLVSAACEREEKGSVAPLPKPVPNERKVSSNTRDVSNSLLDLANHLVSIVKEPSTTAVPAAAPPKRTHKTWTTRVEELLAYKEQFGHVNLRQDNKSKKDVRELAAWIANARCRYRMGHLSSEKAQQLHEIGCEGFSKEEDNYKPYRPRKKSEDEREPNNDGSTSNTSTEAPIPRDRELEGLQEASRRFEAEHLIRARAMNASRVHASDVWGTCSGSALPHSIRALLEQRASRGQEQMSMSVPVPVRRGADPDGALPSEMYPEEDGGEAEKMERPVAPMERNPVNRFSPEGPPMERNPVNRFSPEGPVGAYPSYARAEFAAAGFRSVPPRHHGMAPFLPPHHRTAEMSLLQPLQTVPPRMDPRMDPRFLAVMHDPSSLAMLREKTFFREHLMLEQHRRASNENFHNAFQTGRADDEMERVRVKMEKQNRLRQSGYQYEEEEEDEYTRVPAGKNMKACNKHPGRPRGKRGPKKTWSERMREMREFFLNFGHIQVPTRGAHRELGRWLSCKYFTGKCIFISFGGPVTDLVFVAVQVCVARLDLER